MDTVAVKGNILEVTASRIEAKVEEVIAPSEIKAARTSQTADDLFSNIAGVDVKRTTLGGSKGTGVTIRGFDESRALILLNGRSLNGTGVMGGHYVDWSSISTEDIERIELVRGAKTAEYGNTLGGVVNIVTKKGNGRFHTLVNAAYGMFNTINATISHKGGIRPFLLYDVSAGHWQTDGFLRNNFVDRNTINGRLTFLLPRTILEIGGRISLHKRGFVIKNQKDDSLYYDADFPESDEDAGGGPGIKWKTPDSPFGDGSFWTNIRGQYDVSLQHFVGKLQVDAQAYLNDQDRTEYFYDRADKDHLIYERSAKPEDYTGGWLVTALYPFPEHEAKAGLEGSYLNSGGAKIKSMDSAYFGNPLPTESGGSDAAMRHAAFLQDHWKIVKNIDLELGLRYDVYLGNKQDDTVEKTARTGISPKLGVTWQFWPGGKLNLYTGRALRFPSCPELYWYYGGYDPAIERKELNPEDALQYELGLAQKVGKKGNLEVRGYYYNVADYIRTIFGYKPSRVVYNIDRVEFSGIECEAGYDLFKNATLIMNYTYQITRKEGDILDSSSALTDNLPELPEHKGNVILSYTREQGGRAQLKCRILGERRVITGNLNQAGASTLETMYPFIVVCLQGDYPVYRRGRLTGTVKLGIENLLNTEYEEEYGFPMPGITFNGGVEVGF